VRVPADDERHGSSAGDSIVDERTRGRYRGTRIDIAFSVVIGLVVIVVFQRLSQR
jgi:hypothetical protein